MTGMTTKYKFLIRVECILSATIEHAPNEEVARERFRIGEYGAYHIEDIPDDGEVIRVEKIEEFITTLPIGRD